MASRTYHDPLHRGISLDARDPAEAMVLSLVDSSPFQRLRRIRQLGPAFLTFHGAESSRFTHSLGVFSIARRAMERLKTLDPSLEQQRGVLYGAALLHDLGHAPLSHTGEEMFGTHHEQWSAQVIREHPQIRDSLENYATGTADAVADLLEHGEAERGVIKSLVSSQLDCDRLDYLLRDSYSTGARYGQLDLDRILAAITLAPDGELAIHPKGLMAVEHYLVVRNLMYRSVYNHRLNVMCNWLLERLIQEARHLGPDRIWADSTMHRWLWKTERLDLESYLANDDLRVGYHLQRWQADAPAPLANLCDRFLNRRLLKALDVSALHSSDRLELLAAAQTMSEAAGLEPTLCCGLRQHQLHGYHPYRGGLRLWDGHSLQALEQESALVSSLATPAESAWLIHPREIAAELKARVRQEISPLQAGNGWR